MSSLQSKLSVVRITPEWIIQEKNNRDRPRLLFTRTFSFRANKANGVGRGVCVERSGEAAFTVIYFLYLSKCVFKQSLYTYSKGRKARLRTATPHIQVCFFVPQPTNNPAVSFITTQRFLATFISACIRQLFIKKTSLLRPQTHTCRQTAEWRAQQNI